MPCRRRASTPRDRRRARQVFLEHYVNDRVDALVLPRPL